MVRPSDLAERSRGGIIVPESAIPEQMNDGEVFAVGPGLRDDEGVRHPVGFEVGDLVWYNRFQGTEIVYRKSSFHVLSKCLILSESDIVVVFGNATEAANATKA